MKTVELYNGSIHIEFDEGLHAYRHKEKDLLIAGVTSILGGAIPKGALLPWGCKITSEYWVKQIRDGRTDLEAIDKEARAAHRKVKEAAGTRGTDVHTFCEDALVNRRAKMPSDPETAAGCSAFLSWLNECDLEPFDVERIVFSKKWWYAGKTDTWGRIKKKNAVLDFKSGSGFYDEHPLQLAAYAVALEEETGERIEDGWVIHLDKTNGRPTPYHVPLTAGLKDNWLRVRESYEAIKKTQAMVKEIKNGIRKVAA